MLSYNIWSNRLNWAPRTRSLLRLIHRISPDVICLQEVIPEVLEKLSSSLKEYYFSVESITRVFDFSEVILSKFPILTTEVIPYTSAMDRKLHHVTVDVDGTIFHIGTFHLDSMGPLWYTRISQYYFNFGYFRNYDHAILAGDTNLGDDDMSAAQMATGDWPEDILANVPYGFADLWEALGSPEDCWATVSPANPFKTGNSSARLDRILYRSPVLSPLSIQLVGTQPDEKGWLPSDHFGVLGTFSLSSMR